MANLMAIQNLGIPPSSIGAINSLGEKFTNMSNPKAPPQSASVQHKGSLHPLRDQYEVIALNTEVYLGQEIPPSRSNST